VVAVLFAAGDHVPEMPLEEVVGRLSEAPLHMGETGVNNGATIGLTVTVLVALPDPQGPVPFTV
jgi:hypothetical protein